MWSRKKKKKTHKLECVICLFCKEVKERQITMNKFADDKSTDVVTVVFFVCFVFFCLFFVFLVLLGPLSSAYEGSQARGLIGAIAAGLRHSHSNSRSGPSL